MEEKIVKIFKIKLKPSKKLKIQLKMEIRHPQNKNVLELMRSNETFLSSFVIGNFITLLNQLKLLFIVKPNPNFKSLIALIYLQTKALRPLN
jgi:hypothetical protein